MEEEAEEEREGGGEAKIGHASRGVTAPLSITLVESEGVERWRARGLRVEDKGIRAYKR